MVVKDSKTNLYAIRRRSGMQNHLVFNILLCKYYIHILFLLDIIAISYYTLCHNNRAAGQRGWLRGTWLWLVAVWLKHYIIVMNIIDKLLKTLNLTLLKYIYMYIFNSTFSQHSVSRAAGLRCWLRGTLLWLAAVWLPSTGPQRPRYIYFNL